MTNLRSTRWLRISYRVGAAADGLVAAVLFGQAALAHASPVSGYVPDVPYRYMSMLAGSLMLGWTLLLLWADRAPVARRGVLLITDVVILGLLGSAVFGASSGFVAVTEAAVVATVEVGLIVLFTASHAASVRATARLDGGSA